MIIKAACANFFLFHSNLLSCRSLKRQLSNLIEKKKEMAVAASRHHSFHAVNFYLLIVEFINPHSMRQTTLRIEWINQQMKCGMKFIINHYYHYVTNYCYNNIYLFSEFDLAPFASIVGLFSWNAIKLQQQGSKLAS